MMKYYDYLYYKMYKAANWTNKSIPEWSSMIGLSGLLGFNMVSILAISGIPIKSLDKIGVQSIFFSFLIINYLYFIRKKKWLQIVKTYDDGKKLFPGFLVGLYVAISIGSIFRLAGTDYGHVLFIILGLTLISLIAYLLRKNDKFHS